MKTFLLATLLLTATQTSRAGAGPSAEPAPVPLKCEDLGKAREQCFILRLLDQPTKIAANRLLSFVAVKDARCPIGAVCTWAGFVSAHFILETIDGSVPAQKIPLTIDPRYKDLFYWVDDASGLTIILDDVTRKFPGNQPAVIHELAKIRVGYDLMPFDF